MRRDLLNSEIQKLNETGRNGKALLAGEFNISTQGLDKILRGGGTSTDTLAKMAKYFEMQMEEFSKPEPKNKKKSA